MITPALQGAALLADIEDARREPEALHLWWLGQSGFLMVVNGNFLLFDPYLSDSLTKKYASTDKPHVRMTKRAVDPTMLDFIDVVTSSHNHTDHLDADTLVPLMASNPNMALVIPEANRDFVVDRLSCDRDFPIGLSDGKSLALHGFEIIGVPAAHENVERDESGRCIFMGYIVRCNGFTLYHSGDTLLYEGMESLLRPHEIDIAMLPINGRKPERRVAGNLNGEEAARLAHDIGAGLAIPCHYEMFAFNTESPEAFVEACLALNQPHRVLRCGERMTVNRHGGELVLG